jgi:hypothetical protein
MRDKKERKRYRDKRKECEKQNPDAKKYKMTGIVEENPKGKIKQPPLIFLVRIHQKGKNNKKQKCEK